MQYGLRNSAQKFIMQQTGWGINSEVNLQLQMFKGLVIIGAGMERKGLDGGTKPEVKSGRVKKLFLEYLLFTNWVQGPYQEIQAQGFSYSPSLRGLSGKPRACISWYGTSSQLVNSLLHDPF